jgi:hypothetical protein
MPKPLDDPARAAKARRLRRRPLILVVCVLALAAGSAVYTRLSWIFPVDSDGASNALQAWQMLHGNPLLCGWVLSDVSFYTTELPQYMLVELAHGLNEGVIHIAAAITYTLAIGFAALLAAGRATGRTAAGAACVAAGIMLAPQLPAGILVLLSSPDHIGTSVPVMLAWLILDRARPRWGVPVLVSLILGWAAVADALVMYVAAAPLALVCVIRVIHAMARLRAPLVSQWYELTLAAGAIAAAAASRLALRLIAAFGGFSSPAPKTHIATLSHLLNHNVPVVAHGLLMLFGADFLDFPVSALLVLHLVGVLLAVTGIAVTVWCFLRDRDLVGQVLLAGIAINLAIFLASTSVSWLPTMREIDVVLPFSAALAGRRLAPRIAAAARPTAALIIGALALVGTGYLAGLGYDVIQPVPPTRTQRLAVWLEERHLTDGLSGYWESNVVALTSGDRVRVRLVEIGSGLLTSRGTVSAMLTPGVRESDSAWYDPAHATADFVLLFPGSGTFRGFTDRGTVVATFGKPDQTYRVDGFTVLVWPHANLLARLAGDRGEQVGTRLVHRGEQRAAQHRLAADGRGDDSRAYRAYPADFGRDPVGERLPAGQPDLAAEHDEPWVEDRADRRGPEPHPAGDLVEKPLGAGGSGVSADGIDGHAHRLGRALAAEAGLRRQRPDRLRPGQPLQAATGRVHGRGDRRPGQGEPADLAGRPGRAAVQPTAEHGRQAYPDADPEQDEIVGPDGGSGRVLGNRGEVDVVLDHHRPTQRSAQPGEHALVPFGQVDRQLGIAGARVDHARTADHERAQPTHRDLRPAAGPVDRRAHQLNGVARAVRVLARLRDDPPGHVRDRRDHQAVLDVERGDVGGRWSHRVQRRVRPAPAGLLADRHGQPALLQPGEHLRHCYFGHTGQFG